MIFKLLRDVFSDNDIFTYVFRPGFTGNEATLSMYIGKSRRSKFTDRVKKSNSIKYSSEKKAHRKETVQSPIKISRDSLLKYLFTIHKRKPPLTNEILRIVMRQLRNTYPIIKEIEQMYHYFYNVLTGDNSTYLDDFIRYFDDTIVVSYIQFLKEDITSVKNAISYEISSGSIEENNNKMKLIKKFYMAGLL
jgi:transposase